jgi:long-chain fatty acid adenylyltransferase FadD28
MVNVSMELKRCTSPGDRAVILAPQGLDYIYAFLGAMQAGLIAAPLSVPMGGATDERVNSVLRDASPTVILTTSAIAGDLAQHITPQLFEAAR